MNTESKENIVAKLHELLAVESDLESVTKKTVEEAIKTFKSKSAHFMALHRVCKMYDDDKQDQAPPDEFLSMVTTVHGKLDYVGQNIGKYYDAVLQKELTNQAAKADLVVDGKILEKDLPATFLLGLETKLKKIRDLYESIPTLSSGVEWVPDHDQGDHIYKMKHPEEKYKTAKTFQHKVLYDATDKHPAQIERWEETVNIGKFTKDVWSGMISSADKAVLLGRLDKLLRAVKKARQRANNIDIASRKIGGNILDYINTGNMVASS